MRRRLFRLAPRRAERLADDVDAEIRLHIELRVAELMAQGASRDQAEREALERFGPYESGRADMLAAARHRERRLTMLERIDAIRHDVAYAMRQIRRAPALAAAVTLTFALGIGANATMFGIVDRLLLRPPAHVGNPEELHWVSVMMRFRGEEFRNTSFSYPTYMDIRENVPGFSQVAMRTFPNPLSFGLGEDARSVTHVLVSGNYFQTMRTRVALGRPLLEDDNALPSGQPNVVIGHGLWQREFGGEPSVIGSRITLAGRDFTIVGVAPRGFVGDQTRSVDVFIPVAAAEGIRFAGEEWATQRSSQWMTVVGRLAPGVSPEVAAAQVTAAIRAGNEIERGSPDTTTRAMLGSVLPSEQEMSAERRVAILLGAVSVLVLLIACANVANLLLVRAIARRREVAVRLALGISRVRLMRQLVTESALLAIMGGAAALLVVHWGSALVQGVLLSTYAWPDSAIDGRMLAFTLIATVVVGLLAGLAPALQGSAPDLTRTLKEGTRGSGLARSRLRSTLLVAQAAFAVVLLVGTGLFVRSLRNVNAVDPGLDIDRLAIGTIDLRSVGYDTVASKEYFSRAVAAVQRIPGVTGAVVAEAAPFTEWSMGIALRIPGRDSSFRFEDGPYKHTVMSGYFGTVGTRLVEGRDFLPSEGSAGGERVGIINESAAQAMFPGTSALGECVMTSKDDPGCVRIIGVAENTHRGSITRHSQSGQLYLPYGAERTAPRAAAIIARVNGDPATVIGPMRRAMQSVMPGLPHANVRPMLDQVGNELRPWRLGATMFGVFGALAIVLSALGLYSVIAYSVAQRTHEMGVRVALGARAGDIRQLVLSQGVRLAAIGIALGVAASLAAGRFVASLLYEITPRDPAVYGGVVAVVLAVAVLASLIPATRATRANPLEALRAD